MAHASACVGKSIMQAGRADARAVRPYQFIENSIRNWMMRRDGHGGATAAAQ